MKDGSRNGRQRYKCRECGRRFTPTRRINKENLYADYISGKQTLAQLAERHRVSVSTIQRRLREAETPAFKPSVGDVVLLMDSSYWGSKFGLVAIKDAQRKHVLWRKFIYRHERVSDYLEGVEYLEKNGYAIKGIVCDGMRGLIKALSRYPVQYCQFHQAKYVQIKLTKHPESKAGQELLKLCAFMFRTDKESFVGVFGEWYDRHSDYLNERSAPDAKGKTHYMHKPLRSAFLSVKRNMEHLWVWYDQIELGIPNTNNGIEAFFTDLKSKLRVHNGLALKNREKFIDEYLSRQ